MLHWNGREIDAFDATNVDRGDCISLRVGPFAERMQAARRAEAVLDLTAKHIAGSAAVRLKAPPPLATPLQLESSSEQARLLGGETVIGEAKAAAIELHLPSPPSVEQARAAARSFIGFKSHAFPGCFVCGPERQPHDGLCIFPGALPGSSVIAAPWTPDASLANDAGVVNNEFLWAALDCPGAFAVMAATKEVAVVLGELRASILTSVRPGEACVVAGWPLDVHGRKRFAGTAIFTGDGRPVACAQAVWLEVALNAWD